MNTFLLHKLQQKLQYNKITQWFHGLVKGHETEGTPAETIMEMNDLFIDLVKKKRLNLGVSETIFRRNMCSALCTMKYYKDVNIYRSRLPGNYPAEWNADIEVMWQEWLEVGCFKNWTAFWACVPVRAWEQDMPGWRTGIETILMSYVQREFNALVVAEVIVEDDRGDYIDSNQYDYTEDRWD